MPYLNIIILLAFSVLFLSGCFVVIRSLMRLWLHHRLKLVLLEKLESRPEILDAIPELGEFLESPEVRGKSRQNLVVTGAFLVLIGFGSALVAQEFLAGRYATGVYLGGITCIPLGFLLGVAGLLIHFLTRPPASGPPRDSS